MLLPRMMLLSIISVVSACTAATPSPNSSSDSGGDGAQVGDAASDVSVDVGVADATPFCVSTCKAPIYPDTDCNALGRKWRCDCDIDAGTTPPQECVHATVAPLPGRIDFCCGHL